MRVLIASDSIAGLTSRDVGQVIGEAFEATGATVAVIPMAAGGTALDAVIRESAPSLPVRRPRDLAQLLQALQDLDGSAGYLDLTEFAPLEPAKLLAAIPAVSTGAIDGSATTVLVADEHTTVPLVGMYGIISRQGREQGLSLQEIIAADTTATQRFTAAGVDPQSPGMGAASGAAALCAATGATISGAVETCAQLGNLATVIAKADVVVTGCEQLDFLAVGGPVVREVARLGGSALRPVICVVGTCYVSQRELRLAGLEQAYAICEKPQDPAPTPDQLAQTASKVAATWCW